MDPAHQQARSGTAAMTADELLRLAVADKRTELVRGQLVVRELAGYRHGDVAARILGALFAFVNSRALGRVFTAETGFPLRRKPDTVRAADVSFVRQDRLPHPAPRGFAELAPDLVVEVLSPDDRPGEVLSKVGDWLEAGARLVWVIDPERRDARVYRADGSQLHLSEGDQLDGESVVPGFQCAVRGLVS
jgi:Uma2 family endonuclease